MEKGYAVLTDKEKGYAPAIRSVDESRFGYELPAVHFYELDPLRPHFDVILVRSIGTTFSVLGLRKVDGSPREPVDKATLISVGQACLRYGGRLNGLPLPVMIEVLEIHERDFQLDAVSHLKGVTVWYPGLNNVVIIAYAVGFASGRIWSRGHIKRWELGRYLRRILAERGESEHQMVEAVAASGVSLPHILLGVVVGVLLAFGLRYLLTVFGVEEGRFYGLVDFIGAITATCIAILARRIRSNSAPQAGIAALLYSMLLYGGAILLGASFSLAMPTNAFLFVAIAFMIGSMGEMA